MGKDTSTLKTVFTGENMDDNILLNNYANPGAVSITRERDKTRINQIITDCDSAFEKPITKLENYSILLNKISERSYFYCACKDNKIAGYTAFYANDTADKRAYISLLAVKPEYQGLQIGQRLIEKCFGVSLEYNMKYVLLEVRKDNDKGLRFYKKNGFLIQNENPNEEKYVLIKALW